MKTKKKKVYVNKLFGSLILKNIVLIAIVFLITIALSFFYNNTKSKKFDYSIKIFSNNDPILSSPIFDRKIQINVSKNFNLIVMKYFSSYLNIENKEVKVDNLGNYFLTFTSNKEIEVNNFIEFLNKNSHQMLLNNFQKEIIKLKKQNKFHNEQYDEMKNEILEISEKLKSDELKKMNRDLDSLAERYNSINNFIIEKNVIETNLKLIEFYTKNFSSLFIDDIYFSFNGWQIKNNIYNNIEKTFGGLLFGILINSLLLFFRSNYYKKHF